LGAFEWNDPPNIETSVVNAIVLSADVLANHLARIDVCLTSHKLLSAKEMLNMVRKSKKSFVIELRSRQVIYGDLIDRTN
jgi:hypothetical protein